MSSRPWKQACGRWAPVVVGVALAMLSPVGWQEGAAAALLAMLGTALPGVASPVCFGFGYALLAAAAVAHGGEPLRVGVALLSAALVVWMIVRPGRWPARLLPAAGIGAIGAALLPLATSFLAKAPVSRAEGLERWPLLVVCFAAVLLFVSRIRERPAPRALLALGLGVAAVAGLWRLVAARSALAESEASGSGWERSVELARRAGWTQGERDARLGLARSLVVAGEASRALEALPSRFAVDGRSRLVRADAMLAGGQGAAAMDELLRGLFARIPGVPVLTPAGSARLGLWESRDGRRGAVEHLARGADAPEPARFLAEGAAIEAAAGRAAQAAALLEQARKLEPESPFTRCAAAQIERSPEASRACVAMVPSHLPALQVIADAGDAEAGAAARELSALGDSGVSFGGLLQLLQARLDRPSARAGEEVGLELAFRVLSNGAPEESYRPFVELHDGVFERFSVDPPNAPAWVRGEIWRFRVPVRLPARTDATRMTVVFGMQSRSGGLWLQPSNQPGHLRIVEVGTVEVTR